MRDIPFNYAEYVVFTLLVLSGPWALGGLVAFKYGGETLLHNCVFAYIGFVVVVMLYFLPRSSLFITRP